MTSAYSRVELLIDEGAFYDAHQAVLALHARLIRGKSVMDSFSKYSDIILNFNKKKQISIVSNMLDQFFETMKKSNGSNTDFSLEKAVQLFCGIIVHILDSDSQLDQAIIKMIKFLFDDEEMHTKLRTCLYRRAQLMDDHVNLLRHSTFLPTGSNIADIIFFLDKFFDKSEHDLVIVQKAIDLLNLRPLKVCQEFISEVHKKFSTILDKRGDDVSSNLNSQSPTGVLSFTSPALNCIFLLSKAIVDDNYKSFNNNFEFYADYLKGRDENLILRIKSLERQFFPDQLSKNGPENPNILSSLGNLFENIMKPRTATTTKSSTNNRIDVNMRDRCGVGRNNKPSGMFNNMPKRFVQTSDKKPDTSNNQTNSNSVKKPPTNDDLDLD